MNDLMIDIETLGTDIDSVILSISAVQFNLKSGDIGNEFHVDIDAKSCVKAGLTMSVDTIMWWFEQDKEAQMEIVKSYKSGLAIDLKSALEKFNEWINGNFDTSRVNTWGNSNRFDIGIIIYSMKKCDIVPIWKFWNEKDVRTLSGLAPRFKRDEVFNGVKHYGIDDCKFQISYCHKTNNFLTQDFKD